jgi:hypothetical protein
MLRQRSSLQRAEQDAVRADTGGHPGGRLQRQRYVVFTWCARVRDSVSPCGFAVLGSPASSTLANH